MGHRAWGSKAHKISVRLEAKLTLEDRGLRLEVKLTLEDKGLRFEAKKI